MQKCKGTNSIFPFSIESRNTQNYICNLLFSIRWSVANFSHLVSCIHSLFSNQTHSACVCVECWFITYRMLRLRHSHLAHFFHVLELVLFAHTFYKIPSLATVWCHFISHQNGTYAACSLFVPESVSVSVSVSVFVHVQRACELHI